jgi:hypothetical protein
MMAPHRGLELTQKDSESFEEVNEMLMTRIEQWSTIFQAHFSNKGAKSPLLGVVSIT